MKPLEKFLRDKRVLTEFKREFSRYEHSNKITSEKWLQCSDRELAGAFIFRNAKKGIGYWYDLATQYEEERGE